jgi:hypothetical protein
MQALQEIAIEAVQARYENSPQYGEYLLELEAMGCSSRKITRLLDYAKTVVTHPQAPRALRILKRAAKSAARGEEPRSQELRNIACELVGNDEVEALVEEYRLSFADNRPAFVPERVNRCGFAA